MHTRLATIIVIIILMAGCAAKSPKHSVVSDQKTFTVTRVVDGDTVVLDDDLVVRLIGVDTPEHHRSKKLLRDAERTNRDVEVIRALGKRATAFTKQLVDGKRVGMKYGNSRKGRYGRTLGYLYLQDGTFVNEEIVRQGYGVAYTKYPFKYSEQFLKAEREARKAKRGLWAEGASPYQECGACYKSDIDK